MRNETKGNTVSNLLLKGMHLRKYVFVLVYVNNVLLNLLFRYDTRKNCFNKQSQNDSRYVKRTEKKSDSKKRFITCKNSNYFHDFLWIF